MWIISWMWRKRTLKVVKFLEINFCPISVVCVCVCVLFKLIVFICLGVILSWQIKTLAYYHGVWIATPVISPGFCTIYIVHWFCWFFNSVVWFYLNSFLIWILVFKKFIVNFLHSEKYWRNKAFTNNVKMVMFIYSII